MGVIFKLAFSIANEIPGVSFSITFFVASGVTSRSEKPVPPVVKITCTSDNEDHSFKISYKIKQHTKKTVNNTPYLF